MDNIEAHIAQDKEILENPTTSPQQRRHIEHQLDQLERYQKEHPEDHHDPTDLELWCEDFPKQTNVVFTKIEQFVPGMKLEYDNMHGHVNFIGPEYITLTLCQTNKTDRTRDVNLLVYPWDWKKLKTVPV